MARTDSSPQGKDEKKETPWRVAFTCGKKQPTYTEIRKDLLKACWGNEKMADVLYHFLIAGSWKAYHTQTDASVRVIVLQESHADILTKVKVSEPTLITFLKLFAQVGYVCKTSYKKSLAINFEKVEQAFVNQPDKPVLEKNLNLNLRLKEDQSKEIEKLSQEVEKLTAQVQDLSLTLVSFKSWYAQIEREFKLNLSVDTKTFKLKNFSEDAPEATEDSENFSKNPSLDIKREEAVSTNVSTAAARSFETQENSYSQGKPPTLPAKNEKGRSRAARGYTNGSNKTKQPTMTVVVPALDEGGQRVYDGWCSLFRVGVPLGPKTIEAANALYPLLLPWSMHLNTSLADLLKDIKGWMFKMDKRGFYARGIKLPDVQRDFEGWQSAMEREPQTKTWRERYEQDTNNGGYNDEASFDAWLKTAEEMENAAI